MTLCARFDSFHLSVDGEDVVYGGRLTDRSKVEIRQPATDADVMIVLLASVFEKTRGVSGAGSHLAETATVEAAEDGDVVLSLVSRDVRRSFRLDRRLALQLAAEMGEAAKRPRLRAVT
jgi:hypothetical protein